MAQIKLKFSTYINYAQQNSNRFYVALDYQGQTWNNHGKTTVHLLPYCSCTKKDTFRKLSKALYIFKGTPNIILTNI